MLRLVWFQAITAFCTLFAHSMWSSTTDVTPKGLVEHEWRDPQVRVIKRLDCQGRLTLLTRELDSGRVIEFTQVEGKFTLKTAAGLPEFRIAWKHFFEYDGSGRLIGEVDCEGHAHRFEEAAGLKVNERTGTALAGHKHTDDRR